jgi:8-oxo-dGTP pyrophosphatase MutT (NUDIX family)
MMSTSQQLADIIPAGIFVGTSLILRRDGRFLYGCRSLKRAGGQTILELTGIGGGIEDDDRSFSAGAIREAQEETGSNVQLQQCRKTLIVRPPGVVEKVRLVGVEKPAAVIFRYYRTPPHSPWDQNNQGLACLIIYAGKLLADPRPVMELPWLIWLGAQQILETAHADIPLGLLLAGGAELVKGKTKPPPNGSLARMTDSQEALALALGEDTLAFYQALGTVTVNDGGRYV